MSARADRRMVAAALAGLVLASCNGAPPPGPDAGPAGRDGGEAGLDAATPAPDAGPACPAGRTRCGVNCCDDATETCSHGACFERGCASSEVECGAACCNRATEYCNADNTCHPLASCSSRQVACGAACCDTQTSFCARAATDDCGTLAACKEWQIVCGDLCCDAASQTCDPAVHACKGPQPTPCDPLSPDACTLAESCQLSATGWECDAAGTALEGDSCSPSSNPCAPRLDCLGNLFDAFCFRYCLVGDDAPCRGGLCVALEGSVGICLCDPVHQQGCDGDDACYDNGVSTGCGPPGPGAVGTACLEDRECARALSCGYPGTCARFCDPWIPGDCGPDRGGEDCISYGDGTGFCGTRCEPLQQDCPDAADACFVTPPDYYGNTGGFCARPGTARDGERCDTLTACAKGSNCMQTSADGDFRCLPACDASVRGCGSGGTCVPLGNDGMGGCVSARCDPVAQSGCEPGQGCYWDDATLGFGCATAGLGPEASACAADADCRPGLTCAGQCVPYCRPGAVTSTCAETCREFLGTGFGACVHDDCDPLAQDCAAESDACYPEETGYVCRKAGAVADGLTCTALADCRKGSTCLGSSQIKQCYRMCDTTSVVDLCAASSQTCIAVSGALGVCY